MNTKLRTIFESKRTYELIFITALLASFAAWLCGIFISGDVSRQFDIFYLRCGDFLADTLNVVGYSSMRDVYHNTMYLGLEEKAYPPLTYMMMYFFSRLVNMNPYYDEDYFLDMYMEPKFLIMYMIYAAVGVVMLYEITRTCKNGNSRVKIYTAAAVCLSMPVIYSYERANTIILTCFCLTFYIFYYDSDRKVMKELALIALAAATAFKMTPALLGILLLYNRQWKDAVRAVIYGIIIGIGPFLFFDGGLSNLPQMISNMKMNVDSYGSASGSTLTAAIVSFGVTPTDGFVTVMKWITYAVCLILLATAPFYENAWEKIMAVCMVLIVAPQHSGKYCIIYIIPAVIAFLNADRHRVYEIAVLAAVLLIMYDFQSTVGDKLLNYHLGTVIILAYLLVRSACTTVRRFTHNMPVLYVKN